MNSEQKETRLSNGLALLPFVVFIIAFLGSGIILNYQGVFKPFSQFPPLVAVYLAIITAFILYRGTMQEKMNLLLEGISRPNLSMIVVIFALAGAFGGVARGMGGVDSVVNLCLSVVPQKFVVLGAFFIGCIVSFASGSSMGTATIIVPITLGIVTTAGIPLAPTMGAVMSGCMFGNQFSPVSDTTITSATSMGVSIKDKTKYNAVLVVPAVIIAAILFIASAVGNAPAFEVGPYTLAKVFPYIIVLGLALTGTNVVICLSAGILLAGIIGVTYGDYTLITFVQAAADGAIGMGNNVLLVLLIGGMSYMVDKMGGVNFLVDKLGSLGKTKTSSHLCIAALSLLVMLCVANDTITIMIVCPVAREICKKFHIDPRIVSVTVPVVATAFSPLSPWSGFTFTVQGLVSQAGYDLTFFDTFPVTYYPIILTIIAVVAIFIPSLSSKVFKKEWDFENDCVKE